MLSGSSSSAPPLSPSSVLSALLPRLSSPLLDLAGTERFLARLFKDDKEEAFHRPVKTAAAPDYYDRIAHPMDLSTVRTRFRSGHYATYQQLFDDVERIWANCIQYNGEPDTHYLSAKAASLRDKARLALLRAIEAWDKRDAFEGAAARKCQQLLTAITHSNNEIAQPFTVKLDTTDIWDDYSKKSQHTALTQPHNNTQRTQQRTQQSDKQTAMVVEPSCYIPDEKPFVDRD